MGKDKLRKFRENLTFDCFIQPEFDEVFRCDHPLKGHWRSDFFHNDNPIVLELGCGKGEYTVALAERNPSRNFIGIDIKGARMWRGAKTATDRKMPNVGFLRTRIEFINGLFAEGEVDEIWITFPDPQLKSRRAKKRLTSPLFLGYYAHILSPGGWINLKTDSKHLFGYTNEVVRRYGAGDPAAVQALEEHWMYLSHGIASMINLFAPQRVVVGGGISESGEFYFEHLREGVRRQVMAVCGGETEIVPAQLGNRAGSLGAAGLILGEGAQR